MARVYPAALPDYVSRDPLRAAERKVYEALSAQLPADYVVFYSRPWIGLAPDGSEIDGECDFVVAHVDRGFLALEVKGGAVAHDPVAGTWTSVDRHGLRHSIKNPVEQARRSKHELLRKLKNRVEVAGRFIPTAHGVILPDSGRPQGDLGADMPLRIFAFQSDLGRLGAWAIERLNSASGEHGDPGALGSGGLRALEDMLARSFQLKTPLSSILRDDDQQIVLLTEEQFQILDGMEDRRRFAVSGGAGTGKTLLATEKARRLAAGGAAVLLTCFNRALARHLRGVCEGCSGLSVHSFHELCSQAAAKAGMARPAADELDPRASELFDRALPDALLGALQALPDFRFDAVVVDEAQDFHPDWLVCLEACLRDPDGGGFYVFFDDNQRLYAQRASALSGMLHEPFRLSRNLRNTRQIFDAGRPYYGSQIIRPAGPDGRKVEKVRIEAGVTVPNCVAQQVRRLTGPEGVAPEDIAVLACDVHSADQLTPGGRLAGLPTTHADNPQRGAVVVDSVRRFKGLERPVVVLVEPERMRDWPELLYVGLTRARGHLVIVGDLPPAGPG